MALNNSTNGTNYSAGFHFFSYSLSEKIAIVCANTLIFLLAIPANGIVILVISRVQNVRTPTSIFLMNLCIADIMMASLHIPFLTVDLYITGHWVFGDFMCRLVSFVYYLAIYSSILILTAISMERYISVCLPREKRLNSRNAFATVSVLWFVAACSALPLFIAKRSVQRGNHTEVCTETWPLRHSKAYTTVTLILFYVLPITFMAVVYYNIGRKVWSSATTTRAMKLTNRHVSNSKLRLTKIALAIILSFVISWTPLNIITALLFFDVNNLSYLPKLTPVFYPVFQWVAFSNCALNPLLYCYMSQNFRKALTIYWKRRSRSCNADSVSVLSRTSLRLFSKRGKEPKRSLTEATNGGGAVRKLSENNDCSRTSHRDSHKTNETFIIMSAL